MSELIYEYVIIGGGMAGLHIARLLAKKYPERSICIVEKYDYFGGRVYTHTPRDKPALHYEAGAGRVGNQHKMIGKYIEEFGLTKRYIDPHVEHRHVEKDGSLTVGKNDFTEIILQMLDDLPASIKSQLHTMTTKEACSKAYGKDIVDRVFSEFGYRSETETLRADIAFDTFKGFMGENKNYYTVVEGLSEIPKILAKKVLEMGVRLTTNVTVTDLEKESNCWKIKGHCLEKSWSCLGKRVIWAVTRNALAEIPMFKGKWMVNGIRMEALQRVYARFPAPKGKAWFHDIGHTTTNNVLRYVIPINSAEGLIMISYTDSSDAEYWMKKPKDTQKKEIMAEIRKIFPEKEIPEPEHWSFHPWSDGCSYWLPYPAGPLDARKAQHEVHYPFPKEHPNVFVCGESWSCCQAWMEGAVRNAQGLFDEHL
jgi:monoamine oxidase